MVLLLVILMCTGLIPAGTDIYYPPIGVFIAEYVVDENTDPETLIPYNLKGINEEKVAEIKRFKKPVGQIHLYSAYTLMF